MNPSRRLHEMKEYFQRQPQAYSESQQYQHQQQRHQFVDNASFRAPCQQDIAVENSNTVTTNGRRDDPSHQDGGGGGSGGNGGVSMVKRLLWTDGIKPFHSVTGSVASPPSAVLSDEPGAPTDVIVSSQSGDDTGGEVGSEFDPQADCRQGGVGGGSGVSHHDPDQATVSAAGSILTAAGSPTSSFWPDAGESGNANASFPWDLQLPNPAPPLALPHPPSLGSLRGSQEPLFPRPPLRGGGGISDHPSSCGLDMASGTGIRGGGGGGGFSDGSCGPYSSSLRWASSVSQPDSCLGWEPGNAGGGGGGISDGYYMVSRHLNGVRRGAVMNASACDPLSNPGLPPPPPPPTSPNSTPVTSLGMVLSRGGSNGFGRTSSQQHGLDRFASPDLHPTISSLSASLKLEQSMQRAPSTTVFSGGIGDVCDSRGTGGSRAKRERDGARAGGAAAFPSGMMNRAQSNKRQRLVQTAESLLSGAGQSVGSVGGGRSQSGTPRKTPASSRRCRHEGEVYEKEGLGFPARILCFSCNMEQQSIADNTLVRACWLQHIMAGAEGETPDCGNCSWKVDFTQFEGPEIAVRPICVVQRLPVI